MPVDYTHPNRLPRVDRNKLDKEGQTIFDLIDQTRGGVWGPYTALMHVPELANRVASVGEHLRFHGKLKGDEREFAILCAARQNQSKFEWVVHEPVARKEGLCLEAIEHLRSGKQTDKLTKRQTCIAQIICSLDKNNSIEESLYEKASTLFSKEEIIEIVTIAGFYQMLAYVISAFDVPEPKSDYPSF